VLLLLDWGRPLHAVSISALLAIQVMMMSRFVTDARRLAIWYSSLGVTLYVTGMLVSAFALRGLPA
jgi:chlorophyll synthase